MFSIELYQRYVNPTVGVFYAMIHNPNQIFLSDTQIFIPSNMNDSNGISIGILIKKVEILRRRNKPKEPCLNAWKRWDNLTLLRYTNKVGCTAPYHKRLQNFPMCTTERKMKEWRKFPSSTKEEKHYQPCQEMPRIDFIFNKDISRLGNYFLLNIQYPQKATIITQSRAVDGNALIGNIGGYIG